jgi:hypothetical protein
MFSSPTNPGEVAAVSTPATGILIADLTLDDGAGLLDSQNNVHSRAFSTANRFSASSVRISYALTIRKATSSFEGEQRQ